MSLRFLEEVGLLAGVEPLLPLLARVEQSFAPLIECSLQIHDEGHCLWREDLGLALSLRSENFNAGKMDGCGHRWHPFR